MNDHQNIPSVVSVKDDGELQGFWARHRFFLLIIMTVIMALALVVVSMAMYNISGAAQLDLSRPGYQSVGNQVERNADIEGFEASGPVTAQTLEDFLEQYDEQAAKATAIEAFNGDPLNPELLEVSSQED